MPRVLVVAFDFPYPPNHGAGVDIWNRLLSLRRMGFCIDLIATVREAPLPEHVREVRALVETLSIVPRSRGLRAALTHVPFQVRSRMALRSIPLAREYDMALLESEYVAPILENEQLKAKVRVLRLANDEPAYYRELQRSTDSWLARFFYRSEAHKFDWYAPGIRAKCDAVWFISDLERARHLQRHPEDQAKAVFMPPDAGVKGMRPYSAGGGEVLFLGSLTFPPNMEGLEWYVKEVHPALRKFPGYSFRIAGRTDKAARQWLEGLVRRCPEISMSADPELLDGLYGSAGVFVNPVLRGAGVKLKTIHALVAGVPVVTTAVGMEGTGLTRDEHLLVVDSSAGFAQAVIRMLEDKLLAAQMVRSAQSFLAENYDNEKNIGRSLSSLLGGRVGGTAGETGLREGVEASDIRDGRGGE